MVETNNLKSGAVLQPALTSLRFFAALLVVVFHYIPRNGGESGVLWHVIDHGYVGVSFFFVLSGFVLTYSAIATDFSDKSTRIQFYCRRITRIYPAYFCAAILHIPIFLWTLKSFLPLTAAFLRGVFVVGLTLLVTQAWIPWSLGQFNAPSWTISVEMFLYLMLPSVVRFMRSAGNKLLAATGAILVLLCWLPAWFEADILSWFPPDESLPDALRPSYGTSGNFVTALPVFHLPQFVLGCLAAKAIPACSKLTQLWIWPLTAVVATLLILIALSRPPYASQLFHTALKHGALAVPFAVLFLSITMAKQQHWVRVLEWRPLVTLGDASYSLYIYQAPVMAYLVLASKRTGFLAPWSLFVFGLLLLTIVALVSTVMEARVRPLLLHWLMRRVTVSTPLCISTSSSRLNS